MSKKVQILSILIYLTLALGGAFSYGATDEEIIAATIIAEAGGEGIDGMTAIMNVIENRHKNRKMSHKKVCLQKWQFSCWNGKNVDQVVSKAKNHARWGDAVRLVRRNANGELPSIVGKSDHYHVYRGKSKVSPSWTHPDYGGKNNNAKIIRTLGHHVFLLTR